MPYVKQTWLNGSAGGTPLSAARLQYMEDGIDSVDADVAAKADAAATTAALAGKASSADLAALDILATRKPKTTYGVQYVAPDGLDTNDGLSWGTPKKTLQAAHNVLPTNGGAIFAAAGLYDAQNTLTLTRPVFLKGIMSGIDASATEPNACTRFRFTAGQYGIIATVPGGRRSVFQDFYMQSLNTAAGDNDGMLIRTTCSVERVISHKFGRHGFHVLGGARTHVGTISNGGTRFTTSEVNKVFVPTDVGADLSDAGAGGASQGNITAYVSPTVVDFSSAGKVDGPATLTFWIGNANLSRLVQCRALYTYGDGYHIEGTDSNMVETHTCDASTCNGWGFWNKTAHRFSSQDHVNNVSVTTAPGSYYDDGGSAHYIDPYIEGPELTGNGAFFIGKNATYFRMETGLYAAPILSWETTAPQLTSIVHSHGAWKRHIKVAGMDATPREYAITSGHFANGSLALTDFTGGTTHILNYNGAATAATRRVDFTAMPALPRYTTAARPAAAPALAGGAIFNTSTNIPNFCNGTDWRDAAGVVV